MKRSLFIRITSFLLVMAMVLPMSPMGLATAEEPAVTEILETEPVETLPVETEEPAEETVAPETQPETETLPEEEAIPEETVPEETLPVEEAVPEETIPEEETEPTEETEPEDEPFVFPGLPADYVLTEEELAAKEDMTVNEVVKSVSELTAGYDYAADQILISTDSEAYAQMVAAAFGGTLISCEYGIAVIALQEATVLEAITAAADMNQHLPAVSPNYISRLEPIVHEDGSDSISRDAMDASYQAKDWEYWVRETGKVNDPYITNPAITGYQWMHDVVDTYGAWAVTTGSSNVKVAVIDTGVQADHPELSGKVTTYDIGRGTSPVDPHGTHVAGIVAAKMGNGIGGAGIAPNTSIISINVFYYSSEYQSYTYYDSDLAKAINKAVSAGAWIINMSLGGPAYNQAVQNAINNAKNNNVTVIAVGATDQGNNRASFSTYGKWADVSAPGVDIMSSISGSSYDIYSGTSMAAPVVAGVAALYMSVYGRVSPATMEKILESNVTKVNGSGMGAGVVNAAAMFDVSNALPSYTIMHGSSTLYNNNYKSAVLPNENALTLTLSKPQTDSTGFILYTLDGKTPSYKNNEIVTGTKYSSAIDLTKYAGTTVTVKAAYVSGLGILNKVLTLKLKVGESKNPTTVSIEGPDTLSAGKSGTYTASISPDKADQDVTWSIISRSASQNKATISAKGVLKTVAGASGTIKIRAASKVKSSVYKDFTVNVVYYPPVSKITLAATKLSVNVGKTATIGISSIIDTAKDSIPTSRYDLSWTSSNTKVATVDASGKVTAIAKGTATITCKALDGSNKTAKCTVTVLQPVTSLTITGQSSIAPGASATYKADAAPSTANNKKVTWSLVSAPAGVTVSTSGKVTVAKSVSVGSTIKIRATAADGNGAYKDFTIKVASKATAVTLKYSGSTGSNRATYSNSSLSKLSLFSIQRGSGISSGNNTDISAEIVATATGNANSGFSWTSSNTKVVTISDISYGKVKVTAVGSGTAKITCAALDGSGKKATFTVTVSTPASNIAIRSEVPTSSYPVVAIGKSVKNVAIIGDTYGKPTTSKVTWDFTVERYRNGSYYDNWTSTAKNNKLISISSSGVLSVSSKMKSYHNSGNSGSQSMEYLITVRATTTDGTNLTGYKEVWIVPATTQMKITGSNMYYGYFQFTCDQWHLFKNSNNYDFVVSSSNPDIINGVVVRVSNYSNLYRCYFEYGGGSSAGKATITVKSADGLKSVKFTVNVIK